MHDLRPRARSFLRSRPKSGFGAGAARNLNLLLPCLLIRRSRQKNFGQKNIRPPLAPGEFIPSKHPFLSVGVKGWLGFLSRPKTHFGAGAARKLNLRGEGFSARAKKSLALIEPKLRFALAAVRPVTAEAGVGLDRKNLPAEVDFLSAQYHRAEEGNETEFQLGRRRSLRPLNARTTPRGVKRGEPRNRLTMQPVGAPSQGNGALLAAGPSYATIVLFSKLAHPADQRSAVNLTASGHRLTFEHGQLTVLLQAPNGGF